MYQVCNDPDGDSSTSDEVCAEATVEITIAGIDLELIIDVDNENPESGIPVEFTIILTNIGASNATGIEVSSILPSGYEFVSTNSEVGIYDSNSGIWAVGSLDSGDVVILTITAIALPIGDSKKIVQKQNWSIF